MSVRQLLLVIIMVCIGTFAVAQEQTGTIVGTVKDKTGAVVPHATVTITNTDTKQVIRTLTASDKGEYVAALLPLGHYSVTAEAPNFKKVTISDITLHQNDKLTFDPALEIGATTESVTVRAEALQVETQSATASGTINGNTIKELSLNGRNYEQLLSLVPGVSDSGNFDQIYPGALAPQGTSLTAFSVNGGRREETNYMVDGADNVDRGSNLTLLAFPNADAIQEFKVYRGQYDPELGRAGSGQVNVITRSGTSRLHGDAYEFNRNDAFNANAPLTKRSEFLNGLPNKPPILRYNNFGGVIGGPVYIPGIYKQTDKTFFFFSEDVRRNIVYSTPQALVPSAAMLGGNFRVPVCVAFAANNTCTTIGTSINPANFDPVAKAYITDVFSKYPTPDAGNAVTNPFAHNSTERGIFNFREEIYKIDHRFNDRFSISGKILHDSIPTREPGGLFTGLALDNVGSTSTNSPGHNYTLRGTIAWSPTLLIEPGYTYSYGAILSAPDGTNNLLAKTSSPDVVAALGNSLPFSSTLGRIPSITLLGGSGPATFGPYSDFNINHSWFTNVTKVWNTHTMKFGAVYYHYRKNENAANGNQGTYQFGNNGIPTNGAGALNCNNNGGSATGTAGNTCPFSFEQAWANFLLGRPNTGGLSGSPFSQSLLDLTADIRDNQFEYYAQDQWRWKPNVTVSYGFRQSFFRQPTDALGLLGNFDPSSFDPSKAPCILANGQNDVTKNVATGQFVSACNPNYDPLNGYIFATPPTGFSSHQSPYGSKVGKENNLAIAPRLGVAWDPWKDGKTSIRAGFGMFYDSGVIFGNAENNIFNGQGFQNVFTAINGSTLSFSNPTGGAPVSPNGIAQGVTQGQSRIEVNYNPAYTEQWSLDIQHDLGSGMFLDVGYYGNSGIHLPGVVDINQPAQDAYLACTNATPCFSPGSPHDAAHQISFTQAAGTVVTGANSLALDGIRPFAGYQGIYGVRDIFTSNYNGLQTQFEKKFSGNSVFDIAYTWSHGLTSYIADRTTGSVIPVQGNVRNNNWGPTQGDRRHVVTANYIYELPWYKMQQGFVGHALGGWEISGVLTAQTGLTATVSSNQAVDPSGAGCLSSSPCSYRANLVGDPNFNAPHLTTSWFNASAFSNPVAGQTTIPSGYPGDVPLPGFWRADLGLFKNLKFGEHVTSQLRLETFNTFNHYNPVCCGSFTTSSSAFNTIASSRDPRTLQIGAKIAF